MKPYAALRAPYPAPAPTLSLAERELLQRAGIGAVEIGTADAPMSVALRLSALGFARLERNRLFSIAAEEALT